MGFVERSMVADALGGDADLTRTVVKSVFSLLSRKGFREVGLSGAVDGCKLKPALIGDGRLLAGDAVRLRKGLFEGKVVLSPGEDCLTESAEILSVLANLTCPVRRFRSTFQKGVGVLPTEDETGA